MSAKLAGIVLEDLNHRVTAVEKLILAAIAGAADQAGRGAVVSYAEMARVAMTTPTGAKGAVKRMASAGILAREPAGTLPGRPAAWRLDVERAVELYGAAPAGAGAGAGETDRHWRECEPAVRAAVGDGAFASWLAGAVPESDDGVRLVLAVPTGTIRQFIVENFESTLERITGRTVEIEVRGWAGPAASRRERADP